MQTYKTPGVYVEEKFLPPGVELRTGVPAFLGYTAECPRDDEDKKKFYVPQLITLWPQFEEYFGKPLSDNYLSYAVRGFFETGGTLCYVVPLNDAIAHEEALREGLKGITPLNAVDLVCAPDIMTTPAEATVLQKVILDHCETTGDRFTILDALKDATVEDVLDQREDLTGTNGALYYPWVRVLDGPVLTNGFIPPCGHVAGIYARSDRRIGVHKAPANEVLEGVLDLEVNLTDAQQGELNPMGVNCLRAFTGRGIRVWGARTLAGEDNAEWRYINVRRLFLTAGRWIEHTMASVVFETNDHKLWARIGRELTAYFNGLFQQGALKGRTPQEAFYVKCDAETNPREVREEGMVITEIGLAPTSPNEFVVVRIIHGAGGVTITGPIRPG
jgi:phage tail sheath protein FI